MIRGKITVKEGKLGSKKERAWGTTERKRERERQRQREREMKKGRRE